MPLAFDSALSLAFDHTIEVFGRYGIWGLIVVSFAESSFFPVPPDVMLIPMALARPTMALAYAAATTIASVAGALFAYVVGMRGGRPILARLTRAHSFDVLESYFRRWGGWAVGIAAFTPIPFKVFTIAAGIFRVRLAPFVTASVIGRGARFFLESVLILRFGDRARELLGSRFDLITAIAAAAVIVVFFIAGRLGGRHRAPAAPAAPAGRRPAAESRSPLAAWAGQARQAVRPGSQGRRALEVTLWIIAALVFVAIIVGRITE